MRTISATLVILLLCGVLYAQGPVQPAVSPKIPSWYSVGEEVEKQLRSGKRDLVTWAAEVKDRKPKDLEEAMIKIQLMLRTGLDDRAAEAVKQLKAFLPYYRFKDHENHAKNGFGRKSRVPQTYDMFQTLVDYALHNQDEMPEVAFAVVETFPGWIPFCDKKFPILKTLHQKEWDDAKIERWLAAMRKTATEKSGPAFYRHPFFHDQGERFARPPFGNKTILLLSGGRFPWSSDNPLSLYIQRPELFWMRLQAEHLKSLGRETEMLGPLEQAARKYPTDARKMLDYLGIRSMRCNLDQEKSADLNWVANVFRPQSNSAACLVACYLKCDGAAKMYRLAIDTPLVEGETIVMRYPVQWPISLCPWAPRQYHQAAMRNRLADCLTALKKTKEAKAIRREAFELVEKIGLQPGPTSLLGSAESDFIKKREKDILAKEDIEKKDPKYWVKRARFYRQLKRDAEQEHAYKKGLEVAPYAPYQSGKVEMSPRSQLVRGYVRFLDSKKRGKEAFDLLLQVLRDAPSNSWSADTAVNWLTMDMHGSSIGCVDSNEPLVWRWIASHPAWMRGGYTNNAGQILDRLADMVEEASRPALRPTNHRFPQIPQQLQKGQRGQRGQAAVRPDPVDSQSAFLQRVEMMAKAEDADPSRSLYCANLLLSTRLGSARPKEAIPWLRRFLEHKDIDENSRRIAIGMLFNAYLAVGDIQNAENLYRKQKSEVFLGTQRHRRLAIAAAKQGKADIAIRNWRLASRTSLCNKDHRVLTQSLRTHGLGDLIDAYYHEVKKKLPEFVVPK